MSTPLQSPSLEDQGIHSSHPASGPHDGTRKRKRPTHSTQELGLMRGNGEHDRARFVGSGSGIHYIRAVYLRLANKSLTRDHGLPSKNLVPGEDDQLRDAETTNESTILWKQGEVTPDADSDSDKHSFEDLVAWSRSYFESWHPILPFLNGPDALRIFRRVSDNGIASLDPLDNGVLKSIFSICLSDSRQGNAAPRPLPSNLVFHTVQEAVSTSQFVLSQPASVRSTQAALCIQVFLISMLCLNAASRLGGVIVRMALHLGLHRCPARFAFFTTDDVLIRQRLFWCIYTLERFLCQSLGLPLDLHDDDLDVCYPGDEKHGMIDNGGSEAEKLRLLTYISKHARIRGLILELRNKTVKSRQDDAERTAYVEAEFAKWSNQIQDLLEDEDEDDSMVSPYHRLILSVLKYESTICLHRPLMASVSLSPSYSSALQTCVSASKSILIGLKRHLSKHRSIEDPSHLLSGAALTWPSFTWAVWISTFILLHAASEHQIELRNALKYVCYSSVVCVKLANDHRRHVSAGKDILRHIATRDTSWPEYCLQAVDELTSVVQDILLPTGSIQYSVDSPATLESCADVAIAQGEAHAHEMSSISGSRTSQHENSTGAIGHPSTEDRYSDSLLTESPHLPLISGTLSSRSGQTHASSFHLPTGTSSPTSKLHSSRRQRHDLRSTTHTNAEFGLPQDINQTPNTMPGSSNFLSQSYDSSLEFMPVDGQNSMRWYDQLFQSSFSAIDNPFLVAAESDASINPTWDYLR